jgi:hypothetical protein
MMDLCDAIPSNSLHLLDDFLSSLPSIPPSPTSEESINDESDIKRPDSTSSQHERHNDLVLRVVADLFGNNASLLENALVLLEEHEQSQKEARSAGNDENIKPIIRTIRAKRSCRQAVFIRKQRKSKRNSYGGNETPQDTKKNEAEFYLCLLGRDKVSARNRVHRRGMHCTCRSFLQNIKGGRSGKNSSETSSSSCQNIACKHLLAVILMPHLLPWNEKVVDVETLEDREFAKLVARASIG